MYPLTLLHYPAVIIKSERPEEECNWLPTKTGHGPNCMYQYKINLKKEEKKRLCWPVSIQVVTVMATPCSALTLSLSERIPVDPTIYAPPLDQSACAHTSYLLIQKDT